MHSKSTRSLYWAALALSILIAKPCLAELFPAKTTAWQKWKNMIVRQEIDGNVSCFSKNGRICEYNLSTFNANEAKPLTCGKMHKQVYGTNGYDYPGHWCARAFADLYANWVRGDRYGVDLWVAGTPSGDVMCNSNNGLDCQWGANPPAFGSLSPLVCGSYHKAVYGTDGYSKPNHWCAKLPRPFAVALVGDPQYPWLDADGTTSGNEVRDSEESIPAQFNSINAYHENKFPLSAVFINGDVTAFGQDWQWNYMNDKALPLLKPPVYLGLGNHDIENNAGDCIYNNCLRHSLLKLMKWKPSDANMDGYVSYFYNFPTNREQFNGSFAWSKDINNVHFVVLNNYPGYQYNNDTYDGAAARTIEFRIKPAFTWLEEDLSAARKAGKAIVLIYHQAQSEPELARIAAKYSASLAFFSHVHELHGYYENINGLPSFFTGSVPYHTYTIAKFDPLSQIYSIYKSRAEVIDNLPLDMHGMMYMGTDTR